MTLDSVFQPQNSLEASIYDITFKDTQAFILTEKGLFYSIAQLTIGKGDSLLLRKLIGNLPSFGVMMTTFG